MCVRAYRRPSRGYARDVDIVRTDLAETEVERELGTDQRDGSGEHFG
jgi:hypothetical protein